MPKLGARATDFDKRKNQMPSRFCVCGKMRFFAARPYKMRVLLVMKRKGGLVSKMY